MSLPEALPLFYHCYILSFHLGYSRMNQISLSKPTIINFTSPGGCLVVFFSFVYIFKNNQRQSVGADFKNNGLSIWKKRQREEANSWDWIAMMTFSRASAFFLHSTKTFSTLSKRCASFIILHTWNIDLNVDFILLFVKIINLFIIRLLSISNA